MKKDRISLSKKSKKKSLFWRKILPSGIVIVVSFLLLLAIFPVVHRIKPEDVFGRLNLNYPGLEKVKEAIDSGELSKAKSELVEYYRNRVFSQWFFDRKDRPEQRTSYDTTLADKICQHIFSTQEGEIKLGEDIDWAANPIGNEEWTWDLNKHYIWVTLGEAYWYTGDEKYAKEFNTQVLDWIKDNPPSKLFKRNAWRPSIEAGSRMCETWIDVFYYFINSPNFSVKAFLLMLNSFSEHARFLMKNPTYGNHLLIESTGLFYVGVMFPELKKSEEWRRVSLSRLMEQLDLQIYPDGSQYELSTYYQLMSLEVLLKPLLLAKLNGIELSSEYGSKISKMFEYIFYIVKPDMTIPMINDSDALSIVQKKGNGQGYEVRPMLKYDEIADSQYWKYILTEGKQGKTPSISSHAFPYAGQYVMRTGWDRDDLYLIFDAGPFGAWHQHEDKLNIDVYAKGRTMIVDPGRYHYLPDKWTQYFINSSSHNVVLVNGNGQSRSRFKSYFWRKVESLLRHKFNWNRDKLQVVNDTEWISAPGFDFVSGIYDNGYRGIRDKIIHKREIFFVKPEYWIVCDLLEGAKKPYKYESLFHLTPTEVKINQSSKIVEANMGGGGIALVPLSPEDLSLKVVTGEVNPVQGWVSWIHDQKEPCPTVIYSKTAKTPVFFGIVLYPTSHPFSEKLVVSKLNVLSKEGNSVSSNEAIALKMNTESWTDYFLLEHIYLPWKRAEEIETDAKITYIRAKDDNWQRIILVEGSTLMFNGTLLVRSRNIISQLDIRKETEGKVLIEGKGWKGAEILLPDIKEIKINEEKVDFIREGDYIRLPEIDNSIK